jgi:hypothetical protein
VSLKGREQWLDTLAPKETSIHLPDAQACGMPEQGANCHNMTLMHLLACEIFEGGYAKQAG